MSFFSEGAQKDQQFQCIIVFCYCNFFHYCLSLSKQSKYTSNNPFILSKSQLAFVSTIPQNFPKKSIKLNEVKVQTICAKCFKKTIFVLQSKTFLLKFFTLNKIKTLFKKSQQSKRRKFFNKIFLKQKFHIVLVGNGTHIFLNYFSI